MDKQKPIEQQKIDRLAEIIYIYIYISIYIHIYIYKNGCVCVCVCMFEHNSGTPGAISTKLDTHMAVCMCKNLMYTLHIYFIS
jgi:hypothetical protein